MGTNTPNHDFYQPDSGETGWGDAKNDDWDALDRRLIRKGTESSKPVAGTEGRWFLATDSGVAYYDDGVAWNVVATAVGVQDSGAAVLDAATDIDFSDNLTVTDNGDGTVSVRASGTGTGASGYDAVVTPEDDLCATIENASSGERILLRAGRHEPTGPVTHTADSVIVEGVGDDTIIDFSAHDPWPTWIAEERSGLVIRDLRVTAPGINSRCIGFVACENCTLENITIQESTGGGFGRGIELNDGRGNTVRNIVVDTVENQGVGITREAATVLDGLTGRNAFGNPADVVSVWQSEDCVVSNVRVHEPNERDEAAGVGTYRGISVFDSRRVTVSNCVTDGTDDFGFWAQGSTGIGFVGCTAVNARSTGGGLNFKDCRESWVQGGLYANNWYDGIGVGDHHVDDDNLECSDIVIMGAVCKNNNQIGGSRAGIRCLNGGETTARVTIVGCIASDDQETPTQDAGIRTAASDGDNVVVLNRCDGNVSAHYDLHPTDVTRSSDASGPGLNN